MNIKELLQDKVLLKIVYLNNYNIANIITKLLSNACKCIILHFNQS